MLQYFYTLSNKFVYYTNLFQYYGLLFPMLYIIAHDIYFITGRLYLLISFTNFALRQPLPTLVTNSLFSVSVSPFLFCFIRLFWFSDSTLKCNHLSFSL